MTDHWEAYGPGKPFSNFTLLHRRANFPKLVQDYLKYQHGMSNMVEFCRDNTDRLIYRGCDAGHYVAQERDIANDIWREARAARTDIVKPIPSQETKPMDNPVNADRNEMIALLQGAKGAQFVLVQQCFSRLRDDEDGKLQGKRGPTLTYKAIDLDLKEGDTVVVQYRDRFGVGIVTKVMTEAPTSDEYDYGVKLKHVVQKIDTHRSAQLEELDRQMLRKITASEASDRLERLTRQLGIEIDKITLTLPDVSS